MGAKYLANNPGHAMPPCSEAMALPIIQTNPGMLLIMELRTEFRFVAAWQTSMRSLENGPL